MLVNVLVVEDSPVVLKVLKHLLSQIPTFQPVLCSNYQEAQTALAEHDFFAAIVDLNLPDSVDDEIVDLVLSYSLPCVVLTSTYDDELRLNLLNKGVLDYITKDSRYSFNQAIGIIDRLRKNQLIKVLVAEDSSTSRLFIRALLEQYRFQVVEVENGQEALAKLEEDPSIRLLITDHNMPLVSGYELVRMLRQNSRFQDLVIIGLSSEGESALSAKFIKMGANDFLRKPFYHEEFHCRIIQNLESQEMLETIRNFADLDPLTQLKSRRYLFDEGQRFFAKKVTQPAGAGLAMLYLDDLREVNVKYGHMLGDLLLKELGADMNRLFSDALVCRFGDAEFCLIASAEGFEAMLEAFIQAVSAKCYTDAKLHVTFHSGVCLTKEASLEETLQLAEERLKQARRSS